MFSTNCNSVRIVNVVIQFDQRRSLTKTIDNCPTLGNTFKNNSINSCSVSIRVYMTKREIFDIPSFLCICGFTILLIEHVYSIFKCHDSLRFNRLVFAGLIIYITSFSSFSSSINSFKAFFKVSVFLRKFCTRVGEKMGVMMRQI